MDFCSLVQEKKSKFSKGVKLRYVGNTPGSLVCRPFTRHNDRYNSSLLIFAVRDVQSILCKW